MEDQIIEKIEELGKNEEFLSKIREAQTVEDIIAAHKIVGLDIDASDIAELENAQGDALGELREEELEDVAGGSAAISLALLGIKYFWGVTPGDNYRQKTSYLYNWYKDRITGKRKWIS